jgi:ABC-2 type transport system permease protein
VDVLLLSLVTLIYVLAWGGVVVWVARRLRSGATVAAALLGLWTVAVLVIPLAAGAVAERTIDVPQGGEILLKQREIVNRAWDLPKEATMDVFVASHPEMADHAHINETFEWKWYYAFQQVGDESVADLSTGLRYGVRRRDAFMGTVAWFAPPLLVDRVFSRLARTDVAAFQRYEACARDFHASLRRSYYPMIFGAEPYDPMKLLELESAHACS